MVQQGKIMRVDARKGFEYTSVQMSRFQYAFFQVV